MSSYDSWPDSGYGPYAQCHKLAPRPLLTEFSSDCRSTDSIYAGKAKQANWFGRTMTSMVPSVGSDWGKILTSQDKTSATFNSTQKKMDEFSIGFLAANPSPGSGDQSCLEMPNQKEIAHRASRDVCEEFDVRFAKIKTFLAAFGGQLNGYSRNGYTPLTKAVDNHDEAMIKDLVRLGALINASDHNGATPLGIAINRNYQHVVNILVKFGANLAASNPEDQSTLETEVKMENPDDSDRYACEEFEVRFAKFKAFMMPFGNNVNGHNSDGLTPLIKALDNGDEALANVLALLGANVTESLNTSIIPVKNVVENITTSSENDCRDACEENDVRFAKFKAFMAPFKDNVNGRSNDGSTPLTKAVDNHDEAMVKVLALLGAKLNASDKNRSTPLTEAVSLNDRNMVSVLAKVGANLGAKDAEGWTPLGMAVECELPKMLKTLVKKGADIHEVGFYNLMTVAKLSAKNHHTIKTLKELGLSEQASTQIIDEIFLAHVWGLEGNSELIDVMGRKHESDLEGFDMAFVMRKLVDYVDDFFATADSKSLSSDAKKTILSALENGYPIGSESVAAILSKITDVNSSQPHVILEGSTSHAIAMILCNEKLIVCNRGEGGSDINACEVYSLPKTMLTAKIIKSLQKRYRKTDDFNEMIKGLKLNREGGYVHKDQKVGNCTWASSKAAFGVLCRLYTNETVGRSIYKKFTAFAREHCLKNYLKNKSFIYRPIISQIRNKLSKKTGLEGAKRLLHLGMDSVN